MIDPIAVLNSTNTYIPGTVLGTVHPDGAGGYTIQLGADWMYGVLHYALQPVLILLVLIVMLMLIAMMLRVLRR